MKTAVKISSILVALGLFVLALTAGTGLRGNTDELIIFHAGSLSVPFKQICEEFNRFYPQVRIVLEAAGSRTCARKITDLHRRCDIIACADYTVIETLLIPEYADWYIKFASNEMTIAFRADSHSANQINKDNWYDVLLQNDVTFGRSDPNADPCGYRAVLAIMLAEKFYSKPGLARKMLAKDHKYIRPKEVDLLALLEAGELDYVLTYRSVARQHELKYVVLPDHVNLGRPKFAGIYKNVSLRITGKSPGSLITKVGGPILYGVTIPDNAPNRTIALAFLTFLLDADAGGAILESSGQTFIVPSPTDTFHKLPQCLRILALRPGQEANL